MCDFSLKNVKSRSATALDKLVTHNFTTGTFGFRAADDSASGNDATALCILPGTEIAFSEDVRMRADHQPGEAEVDGETKVVNIPPIRGERTATFIQVNKNNRFAHHDALQFADGNIILLNSLADGQHALIVTMPARPETPVEREEQRRIAYA